MKSGDHDGTLRPLDGMSSGFTDLVTTIWKDGKDIDDVLLKMHLMHSHYLQNPLVYVMPLGIQRCFLKLEINIKLTFKTLPCYQFSLNH
ncbi:hypothetical protein AAG906_001662 [Vitis piasezkii]